MDDGSTLSTSVYLSNLSEYRAKGIKLVKKEELTDRQKEINDFVQCSFGARSRSRTVALLCLSIILNDLLAIRITNNTVEPEKRSRSLTRVTTRIMSNILSQLIATKGKELSDIIGTATVSVLCSSEYLTKAGKPTIKGKKIVKCLGLKSIKNIHSDHIAREGHMLLALVNDVIPDIILEKGRITLRNELLEELLGNREGIIMFAAHTVSTLDRFGEAERVLHQKLIDWLIPS